MRKRNLFITILLTIFLFTNNLNAFAHPGRTDSSGGHWDRSTGTYHYHNGGTSSGTYNSNYSTITESAKNQLMQKESLLQQREQELLLEIQNLESKIEELNKLKNETDELIKELESVYKYKVDYSEKYFYMPYISFSIAKIYLGGHTIYSRDYESIWTSSLNFWENDLIKAEEDIHKNENKIIEIEKTLTDKKSKYTLLKDDFIAKNKSNSIKKLLIHYIDVGQADSILIQDDSVNMLIDSGNNEDEKTIIDYLKKQGVKKLDVVVATHPHEDHIGSMDAVVKTFDIGKIYAPKVSTTTKTFEDLLLAIKNKNLKITEPKPGETFKLNTAECTILGPINSKYEDINDYSIVLKMTFGINSFLFMGDAEVKSESEILEKKYNIAADLIKIGHHGSDSSTSTDFLNKVNPKYAVISVGKGNDYGHPTQGIMDKLKNKKIDVYRTDENKTIIVTSDGKSITFNVKPGSYTGGSVGKSSSGSTSKSGSSTVTPPSSSSSNSGKIVYITKTGSKYHTSRCRYLSKSKIQIKLNDAKAKGYTPCSVCKPPISYVNPDLHRVFL